MIIGVDLGSKQVKTSAKIMFDNRYTQKEELYSSAHKIEIDGQVYYIGEGDYICDVDEPVLVMEEHLPSDDYYYCGGADYESEEDYD